MTKNPFTIFPAIDLRHGRVVRLSEGDPNRQTGYSENPAEVARQWLDAGAVWLHVVNLDAALGEDDQLNQDALDAIMRVAHGYQATIQLGGGIRDLGIATDLLNRWIYRVIFGTLAITQPDLIQKAMGIWGNERVAVSLDARGSEVLVRGWQENSGLDLWDTATSLKTAGLKWLVYTDVSRDGLQTGFNQSATTELAQKTGLKVIASGGVRSIEDIHAAREAGLAGIILGRALYEGKIDLADAIKRFQNAG